MNIWECFKDIQLIVYDFDGVMTDNRVLVNQDGIEAVFVHRGDGYGVRMLKEMGYRQIIISTEANPVVAARGKKLGLEVIHNSSCKTDTLNDYCQRNSILLEKTLFIGNDLNDYDAMMLCGIKACPADAEPEILEISDWISSVNGGYGVIRELYRLVAESTSQT